MGTCEGRDGSCDWFSQVAHIYCTGCILPRELRWLKEWFKAQWPGVIMLEAPWDALRVWKALYKKLVFIIIIIIFGRLTERDYSESEPRHVTPTSPRRQSPLNLNIESQSSSAAPSARTKGPTSPRMRLGLSLSGPHQGHRGASTRHRRDLLPLLCLLMMKGWSKVSYS